jgi:hypothetical protein
MCSIPRGICIQLVFIVSVWKVDDYTGRKVEYCKQGPTFISILVATFSFSTRMSSHKRTESNNVKLSGERREYQFNRDMTRSDQLLFLGHPSMDLC